MAELLDAFADFGQGRCGLFDLPILHLPLGHRDAQRNLVQLIAEVVALFAGRVLSQFGSGLGSRRIVTLLGGQLLAQDGHARGCVDAEPHAVAFDLKHLDRGVDRRQDDFLVVAA